MLDYGVLESTTDSKNPLSWLIQVLTPGSVTNLHLSCRTNVESQTRNTNIEPTWTFIKRKVKTFKTLNLIKQCNDTALALVRWKATDLVYPVGMSHQTLWQQRIIQDDEGMTCYSTYSRKHMTHKGTLTSHYSPYNSPLAFKNPTSFTRSHGLLRFAWSLSECVLILCDLT